MLKKQMRYGVQILYMPRPDGAMRYNCSILDYHDRSIVATLNGSNITIELAIATLHKALDMHKSGRGIILHSDQGGWFTAKAFNDFCEKNFVQAKHKPC